jgi:hypothetical protein
MFGRKSDSDCAVASNAATAIDVGTAVSRDSVGVHCRDIGKTGRACGIQRVRLENGEAHQAGGGLKRLSPPVAANRDAGLARVGAINAMAEFSRMRGLNGLARW